MRYKLINKQTEETHLCDKVTIDGFNYYVSDETPKLNDTVITASGNIHYIKDNSKDFIEYVSKLGKKVIATNNSNIDIPQVVDEVENLAKENRFIWHETSSIQKYLESCFIEDSNKFQQTHQFSEEDVKWIFAKTLELAPSAESHTRMISDKQYRNHVLDSLYYYVIQLWKEEQKSKIVYYND